MTEVWRLLACQWGGLGAFAAMVGSGWLPVWGAWLPALVLFFGAALYVWVLAPDAALPDRAEIRALAWGAGWRTGALGTTVATGFLMATPDAWQGALQAASLLGVVALVGTAVSTALTLAGLDAGRTNAHAG